MGAVLSSVIAVLCFAVYVPLFMIAMRHLMVGEVKIRKPIAGGIEIKRIAGYRATIFAFGQLLTWFPAAYGALMVVQTRNLGFLGLGVIFSFAIGYVNTLLAQRMSGEITEMTFQQMGFKFDLQNFARTRFGMNVDNEEKPKRDENSVDIEDAVFYDVDDGNTPQEKRKNDEDE